MAGTKRASSPAAKAAKKAKIQLDEHVKAWTSEQLAWSVAASVVDPPTESHTSNDPTPAPRVLTGTCAATMVGSTRLLMRLRNMTSTAAAGCF